MASLSTTQVLFLILVGSSISSVTSINAIALRSYHPLVQEFASSFIDKIVSSPKYFNAFSPKDLSRDEAAQLFYGLVFDSHDQVGDPNPEFSAISVHQAVKRNFDVATILYVVEVYAYTVGEQLFQRGVLNPDNVSKLSDRYFKSVAYYIDLVDVSNHSAETNISAISEGFLNFMSSFGLFNKNNAFTLAATFSQVWHINRL